MNQEQKQLQAGGLKAFIKNKRVEVRAENERIFKEFGISTNDLLKQIEAEMESLQPKINYLNKNAETFKLFFSYESRLQGLIQMIDFGTLNALEIQEGFTEAKEEFKAIANIQEIRG